MKCMMLAAALAGLLAFSGNAQAGHRGGHGCCCSGGYGGGCYSGGGYGGYGYGGCGYGYGSGYGYGGCGCGSSGYGYGSYGGYCSTTPVNTGYTYYTPQSNPTMYAVATSPPIAWDGWC